MFIGVMKLLYHMLDLANETTWTRKSLTYARYCIYRPVYCIYTFFNREAGHNPGYTPFNNKSLYAPYNVDIDVAPGQNGIATFVANQPGIFLCACKYHAPSMVGHLIIMPHQA